MIRIPIFEASVVTEESNIPGGIITGQLIISQGEYYIVAETRDNERYGEFNKDTKESIWIHYKIGGFVKVKPETIRYLNPDTDKEAYPLKDRVVDMLKLFRGLMPIDNKDYWDIKGYHNALDRFDFTKYEYTITTDQRKDYIPKPEGDGWEEIDWRRDDFTDTGLWRRLKVDNQIEDL